MEGLYTTILHDKRAELKISIIEYCFLDSVYHLSRNNGYCYKSKKSFAEFLGISERQVFNIIKKLIEKGFLIKVDDKFLSVTDIFCSIYEKTSYMKELHTDYEKTSYQTMKKLHKDYEKISYNNNIYNNKDNNNIYMEKFEKFRIIYRNYSKVRGLETEYNNLKKKHKDYKEIINYLYDNIDLYEMTFKNRDYQYHLETYINKRQFEEVSPELVEKYRLKKEQQAPKPIEEKTKVYLSSYTKMNRKANIVEKLKIQLEQEGKELIIDCELL